MVSEWLCIPFEGWARADSFINSRCNGTDPLPHFDLINFSSLCMGDFLPPCGFHMKDLENGRYRRGMECVGQAHCFR